MAAQFWSRMIRCTMKMLLTLCILLALNGLAQAVDEEIGLDKVDDEKVVERAKKYLESPNRASRMHIGSTSWSKRLEGPSSNQEDFFTPRQSESEFTEASSSKSSIQMGPSGSSRETTGGPRSLGRQVLRIEDNYMGDYGWPLRLDSMSERTGEMVYPLLRELAQLREDIHEIERQGGANIHNVNWMSALTKFRAYHKLVTSQLGEPLRDERRRKALEQFDMWESGIPDCEEFCKAYDAKYNDKSRTKFTPTAKFDEHWMYRKCHAGFLYYCQVWGSEEDWCASYEIGEDLEREIIDDELMNAIFELDEPEPSSHQEGEITEEQHPVEEETFEFPEIEPSSHHEGEITEEEHSVELDPKKETIRLGKLKVEDRT